MSFPFQYGSFLRAAFRPGEEILVVRAVARQRDVMGTTGQTTTGRTITQALVAGERNPKVLARHRRPGQIPRSTQPASSEATMAGPSTGRQTAASEGDVMTPCSTHHPLKRLISVAASASLLAVLVATAAPASAAETQGVSKTEILIATIQDLSGPVAAYGKAARNGMQLRVDEINEQGGIHGRKIKLLVEDNGYDPKKAVLAAQKLVTQDKVFLIASHIGTPMNNAVMPLMFEKGVINFMPLSAGREMFDPPHKLKFASVASYFETMRMNVPKLFKEKSAKQACALYQDDDYGLEVLRGAEAGLKEIGVTLGEKTTYKRGATDFSSQVARLKASNCDFLVMGTIVRETIGTIAEARKTGWNPTFVGSQASYTDLIHKLGGKGMDGYYAVSTNFFPYLDLDNQPLRFWANKYKTKFNDDPSTYATGTYAVMDVFLKAALKAGPNLTTDSFVKAMETMGEVPADMFGTPPLSYTPTKRLGSNLSRLSQIQDGRWKVVSDLR